MIEIHKEDITELLVNLDAYAASVNAYEYGLPISTYNNRLLDMQNIVEKWLRKQGLEYKTDLRECIK